MKVDLDLIRKYNVPGPRYTSYPPATHFTDEVDKDALMESIRKNNETQRDLSLYYHLSILRIPLLVLRLHDGDYYRPQSQ